MLLNEISSVNLTGKIYPSPNAGPFIGCAIALYTAGCEVSLKEEKNTKIISRTIKV